jgi:putative component of toxin-antitoxin plasmid stabilization module
MQPLPQMRVSGEALIILLVGGAKSRQQRDIETAQAFWEEHKRRKRG